MRAISLLLGASALLPLVSTTSLAQRDDRSRVRNGVVIGNAPLVKGIRINFRDRDLQRVDGVNITIWMPHDPLSGDVHGLALGLPLTGAANIEGAGVGILGVGAANRIDGLGLGIVGVGAGGGARGLLFGGVGVGSGGALEGISIGGIGVGAGGGARGITIGGVGVGSGGSVRGLTVGGIGVGAGGGLWGVQIGGIGVGTGGDLTGLSIGGIGAAGGGDVSGITIAGVGVGAGGHMQGIQIAGVGIGGGGGMTGLQVAGVGIGTGGKLRGISIAGVGVGAPRIEGFVAAAAAGAQNMTGLAVAPILFRIENDGELRGASISAVNRIQGLQRGVAIGIVNYTHRLRGAQVGLINIVRENPSGRRVLPIVNWGTAP